MNEKWQKKAQYQLGIFTHNLVVDNAGLLPFPRKDSIKLKPKKKKEKLRELGNKQKIQFCNFCSWEEARKFLFLLLLLLFPSNPIIGVFSRQVISAPFFLPLRKKDTTSGKS